MRFPDGAIVENENRSWRVIIRGNDLLSIEDGKPHGWKQDNMIPGKWKIVGWIKESNVQKLLTKIDENDNLYNSSHSVTSTDR